MESLFQDLRFGLRMLAKRPGFSAVVVLVLALGIGANTAIFSIVEAVLLRALPYQDPDRIVFFYNSDLPEREDRYPLSDNEAVEYARRNRTFDELAAFGIDAASLTGGGEEPVRVRAAAVADGFFRVFGIRAALGRTLLPEEDRPGADGVVVLSHGLWQRRFASDPGIVGREVVVDGRSRVVVGVMPAGFDAPPRVELWVPLAIDPAGLTPESNHSHGLSAVAKLPAGMSLEAARARADLLVQSLADLYPDQVDATRGAELIPMKERLVGSLRPALVALLAAVGFVLLIACANVANLLLARSESRLGEIALRSVLGGGRGRILRQLVTESVVLSLLGGAVGLLMTWWGLDLLLALLPGTMPRVAEIEISAPVLVYALSLSLGTGVLAGVAPAFQASRSELHGVLKEGGRGSTEGARRRLFRGGLVVAEVALVVVLLAGAGLMAKSFWRLLQVEPGVDPEGVLTFQVFLSESAYPGETEVTGFFDRLLGRLERLPGVEAAGAVSWLPFATYPSNWFIEFEGGPPYEDEGLTPLPDYALVSGDYFASMGIPLLRGRAFNEEDRRATPGVILTEKAARLYWPGQDPLGKRIRLDLDSTWRTVVGIVGDHKNRGLEARAEPGIYLPHGEINTGGPFLAREMAVTVRGQGDPLALAGAAREQVRSLDPDLPVARLESMEEVLSNTVAQPRFTLLILVAFASVGLVLGAVGVYGVLSYTVARRTRELGIRIALGARAGDVRALVLGRGLRLVAAGVALGLLGAYWLTRALMASLLFEVEPTDPQVLLAILALLLAVGLGATLLPARRAVRVDPVVVLKEE